MLEFLFSLIFIFLSFATLGKLNCKPLNDILNHHRNFCMAHWLNKPFYCKYFLNYQYFSIAYERCKILSIITFWQASELNKVQRLSYMIFQYGYLSPNSILKVPWLFKITYKILPLFLWMIKYGYKSKMTLEPQSIEKSCFFTVLFSMCSPDVSIWIYNMKIWSIIFIYSSVVHILFSCHLGVKL